MFKNLYRNYSNTSNILKILKTGQLGQQVFVQGWIKSLRKQKEITFLDVNDGSTLDNLQIIHSGKIDGNITVGSSVNLSGILKQSPKGSNEIHAEVVTLLGKCDLNKYPFAPRKKYASEYIREHLHLRPRTKKFASVLRVRHAASLAIHNYLDQNGYILIHNPILTSNDCEGAGETFQAIPENEKLLKSMVKEGQSLEEAYFSGKAYLTVSGQLHLEAAAHALNKVYCFGPTFRAENSKSRLHLSEFYMLELEQAFLDNLDDLLTITEDLLKNVTAQLLEKNFNDIQICTENKIDHSWIDKPFVKISYTEAVDVLTKKLEKTVSRGLNKEHELALTEYFGFVPVFVVDWPKHEKPFYMKEIDNNNVAAFDLLAPQIGEIVGGSLRENNYDKLKSKITTDKSQFNWYLDLRQFGSVPTGGFGLGFERYIQFLLGIDNIKDSIPFPRGPHNCKL